MDYKDYYDILKVKKESPQDEIQKAYKKLARKFHPDVNKSPDAEKKFKDIGEAYEVLKDPEKRQRYDQYGAAWKHAQQGSGAGPGAGGVPPGWQGFDFGGMGGQGPGGAGFDFRVEDLGGAGGQGFSSFFDMLFGSAGAAARGRQAGFGTGGAGDFGPRPGADAEATLALTLEEAIRGGPQQFSFADPSADGERKSISVRIPAGVRSGQRIRIAGRGLRSGNGGRPGDLYLRIEVAPDERFRIDGNDLYTPLAVAPWEAALGTEAGVATPDGEVRVKVPAGSSSGRKIRLRGRGLPPQSGGGGQRERERERGDLFAEIKVVVPAQLNDRERELFEELRQVSTFQARTS